MWTAGRQYIRMQRLALPLARDGRNVDMVFACHVRVDATAAEADAIEAARRPVREHLDAYYWCGDFSLIGGVVLHDYMAAEAK
jgi:hypothetical protein